MPHTYSYQFTSENRLVSVQIEHNFDRIDDLEDISRFPHRHRRNLAQFILSEVPENTFYMGDQINISNPFVAALSRLFKGQYWYYWTHRNTDTLIYITGLSAFFTHAILYFDTKFHRFIFRAEVLTTVSLYSVILLIKRGSK